MKTFKAVKKAAIAFFTILSSWLGTLATPVYILIILNTMDYFTGYIAAPYRGRKRRSEVGFRGIAKKVCMYLLVAIGWVLDWLVAYAAQMVGVTIPFHFLAATLVAIWLICNEIISILENIGDIGVDLPPFILPLVRWVKAAAEDKAKVPDRDKNQ